jgi:predicted peptidase
LNSRRLIHIRGMKRLITLTAALFFIGAAAAQSDMPRNQTAQSTELSYTKTITLRYLLYTPKGYGQEKKKWPLMVFLHGAGERGTNLAAVAVHGPPKLVKEGKDLSFVLISPQCATGDHWQPEALMALVDEALKKYEVDPERVYLTGLSMGGFGSWALATMYPERFAAVAPICGGGNVIDVLLPAKGKEAALKSLPIWAFHGAKDPVVKLEESERMVEAFKRAGNSAVKLTVYPEAQHDSWTEAYNDPELFKWFLEQKRPQTKKTARK